MRNPLRTAARALLVLLAATSHGARAFKDYQVMVYFVNAPWGADLAALAAAKTLFESVMQWLLTCEFLEPGKAPTTRNRELAAAAEEEIEPESSQGRALRGAAEHEERDLSLSTCPSTCSNSGTTKCRSLGCAFCGRCRRDLQTTNTTTDFTLSIANALKIEGTFNSGLKIFCLFKSTCKIYAKIYRISANETAVPITG